MKKGLSQICFRHLDIREGLKLCRDCGFQGMELLMTETGALRPNSGSEDFRRILGWSEEFGVELTSLCMMGGNSCSLTDNNPLITSDSRRQIRCLLEAAAALGIETVLITGGRVTAETPYDLALERIRVALHELRPDAERLRVNLAVENVWNKLLLSPVEFRDLLDSVGSEYVGAYFDTGNVVLYGFPEQWIRILGPRIKKVHFKDFRIDHKERRYEWTQLLDGSVNWPAVMRELRAVGYDDYVISEVDGDSEVFSETARRIDQILNLQ